MKKIVLYLLALIPTYSLAQQNNDIQKNKITTVINQLQKNWYIDASPKDTIFIHLVDSNLTLHKFFYFNKNLNATNKFIPCDEVQGLQRHCLFIYQKDTKFKDVDFIYHISGLVKGWLQLVFENGNYEVENSFYTETIK